MAHGIGKCGHYAVTLAYVSEKYPFVRAVRRIREAGARVEYIDEAGRRIVANIPASRIVKLILELGESGALSSVSFEVKSSCRHTVDLKVLGKALRDMGFVPSSQAGDRRVYVGRHKGRVVEVEVDRSRVRVKVGRISTGRPRPPVPPALFLLDAGEVGEAFSVLKDFLDSLKARLRGGGSGG